MNRFWSKVDKNGPMPIGRQELGPCWVWTAALSKGYGRFWIGSRPDRVCKQAHRLAYEQIVAHVPEWLDLDHLCRNRCCVNPSHLEPVTRSINLKRGNAGHLARTQQLAKTHCPQGHPYSGDNLIINNRGARICRKCRSGIDRRYRERNSLWQNGNISLRYPIWLTDWQSCS